MSPDTIVPDAGMVFGYNRYMYVYGNPLKYNDPTGNCAGNSQSDENYDAACWEFLKNEFCNGIDCINGAWYSWVTVGEYADPVGSRFIIGDSRWTIESLRLLQDALLATKSALQESGFSDWRSAIGSPQFRWENGEESAGAYYATGSGNITIFAPVLSTYGASGTVFAIAHEIGHALDFEQGGTGTLGAEFLETTGAKKFSRSNRNCMRGYSCGNSIEAWPDAFAALVVDYNPGYLEPTHRYADFAEYGIFRPNWNFNAVVNGASDTLRQVAP